MRFNGWRVFLDAILILIFASACTSAGAAVKVATQEISITQSSGQAWEYATLTAEASLYPTSSLLPTDPKQATSTPLFPSLSPTISPSQTPLSPSSTATPCPADVCTTASQYFLARPITLPGNDKVDASYRFGSTQGGRHDPHHGVEFLNRYGTPVLAAADGVVVVAGDDRLPTSAHGVWPITFYGLYSNFYGNLVAIEHPVPEALRQSYPGTPQNLYTLYGHLSEISVKVGDVVKTGQQVGKVGMTGIAEGNHLHFEVRLGENSYKSSRNPELWLQPHLDQLGEPMGGIAGRFIDAYGVNQPVDSLTIQHLPEGPNKPADFQITLQSYEEKGLIGQPPWGESFGIGDLPAGTYRVAFTFHGLQKVLVKVLPGQLTMLTFNFTFR